MSNTTGPFFGKSTHINKNDLLGGIDKNQEEIKEIEERREED